MAKDPVCGMFIEKPDAIERMYYIIFNRSAHSL